MLTEHLTRRWWVLAGALVVALALVATISLTVEAAEDETLRWDVVVATTIQRIDVPGVQYIVDLMNWAGRTVPLLSLTLLVVTALALLRRRTEMLIVLPVFLVHPVNFALKQLAGSPRPTAEYVRITDTSHGFGFPSGHTMGIFILCGVLAYLAVTHFQRRSLQVSVLALATFAALAVGFSRIYSGAHWPSDVLGAYLWGAFYVGLLIVLHQVLSRRASTAPEDA